jgi:hypothetical protein
MKAEEERQADTGKKNRAEPEGLAGAETDVTTRWRTKAEWSGKAG